jgi:hypothetical protein
LIGHLFRKMTARVKLKSASRPAPFKLLKRKVLQNHPKTSAHKTFIVKWLHYTRSKTGAVTLRWRRIDHGWPGCSWKISIYYFCFGFKLIKSHRSGCLICFLFSSRGISSEYTHIETLLFQNFVIIFARHGTNVFSLWCGEELSLGPRRRESRFDWAFPPSLWTRPWMKTVVLGSKRH